MINVDSFSICEDNCSPATPIVLADEFSEKEIEDVLQITSKAELKEYKSEDLSFHGSWIEYSGETHWLYEKLYNSFLYSNRTYRYDDLQLIEKLVYIEFSEKDFQEYHLDIDMGIPFSSRRLAACVNLSASEEYRGGEFYFMTSNKPYTVSRAKGSMIISPAYLLKKHEVIRSGKKKILVAWMNSPNFKQA